MPGALPAGHFTADGRHLLEEDAVHLTTVGVDIGSSTSHLVFSRIELQREGTRYVVSKREVLARSNVALTPYRDGGTRIDEIALGRLVADAYEAAGLSRDDVDTGALILTGAALQRENARAIADLFADEAGRFVAVTAGDHLESLLAAHGSGAAALSAENGPVLHVDMGGGTTKLAWCEDGEALAVAALDVGARLVALDEHGRVARLEPAGQAMAAELGLMIRLGDVALPEHLDLLAEEMAERLVAVLRAEPLGPKERALLRTDPLPDRSVPPNAVTFSGGVSEFLYGRETRDFGDLGPRLARALLPRIRAAGLRLREPPGGGIRATVLGASQYTVQLSGSTIFIAPVEAVPLRNAAAIRPALALGEDQVDPALVARGVAEALARANLDGGDRPVALAVRWEGLATYSRIDAFCRGVVQGLDTIISNRWPLVLVFEGDLGGLFGLHLRHTLELDCPVISIDGVRLGAFDHVDIGALVPSSGAVPVVIKSLVFPTTTNGRHVPT